MLVIKSTEMLPYFLYESLPESDFNIIVRELHLDTLGQPDKRTNKPGRDIIAYPVPECMINQSIAEIR